MINLADERVCMCVCVCVGILLGVLAAHITVNLQMREYMYMCENPGVRDMYSICVCVHLFQTAKEFIYFFYNKTVEVHLLLQSKQSSTCKDTITQKSQSDLI